MKFRWSLWIALASLTLLGFRGALTTDQAAFPINTFLDLQIGGGGLVTGLNINPSDGTRLARTDAYGCYNYVNGQRNQLVVQSALPSSYFGYSPSTGASQVSQNGGGCYEIASAPTNSSDLFIVLNTQAQHGEVFLSKNSGTSFSATNFFSGCPASLLPNDASRINGPKMAVGLQSADLVYVGTISNGMCVSTNATQASPSWALVTGLPTSATGYNIVFDPSDATGNTAYACVPGNGVYITTTTQNGASSTWTKVTTSGMPTSCQRIAMAGSTGVLLTISGAATANGTFAYYTPSSPGSATGTWTTSPGSPGSTWHSVAADPANCASISVCHIAIYSNGFGMDFSTNGGTSWNAATVLATTCPSGQPTWQCNAAVTPGGEQSDIAFEVAGPNGTAGRLDVTLGQGLWYTAPPTSGSTVSLTLEVAGVEEVVPLQVIAPNGIPVTGSEDVGVFQLATGTSFPTMSGNLNNGVALLNGWAIDYVASSPNFMVDINGPQGIAGYDYSGTSSDGGVTWTPFNSYNFTVAGSVVVQCGTGSNICVTIPSAAVSNLTSWSNGSGSVVTLLKNSNAGLPSAKNNNFPAVVNPGSSFCTSPCLQLLNSTYTSTDTTSGNYLIYLSSHFISNQNGSGLIQNVSNSSGAIQVTWSAAQSYNIGDIVCIKNVNAMPNGTVVNGCWPLASETSLTGVLFGSTFVTGDSYQGGGEVDGIPANGGAIAAASTTNYIWVPSNNSQPFCTQNGGQTWTDLSAQLGTAGVQTYGTIALITGNGTTMTVTTNAPVNMATLASNNTFTIKGSAGGTFDGTYTANGGSGTTVTAASAISGSVGAGGAFLPARSGWPVAYFTPSHIVVADRVTPNTFYLYNFLSGIISVTNCTVNSIVNTGSLANNSAAAHKFGVNSGALTTMKPVPGQAGHFFFTVGPQGTPGSGHPSPQGLWRTCDGGVTMTEYTNFFEVGHLGYGAPKAGQSYDSEYIQGWQGSSTSTSVYGIWRSFDDPNNGVTSGACNVSTQTWAQIGPGANGQTWPRNWMAGFNDITGSNTYGAIFMAIGAGGGFAYANFP